MFFVGVVIIVVSIVLIISGLSTRKRGDISGVSLSLIGKIGIIVGIIALGS